MNITGMDANAMFGNPETQPRASHMYDAYQLAQYIARLNPEAGTIGAGMLIRIISEARRIVE